MTKNDDITNPDDVFADERNVGGIHEIWSNVVDIEDQNDNFQRRVGARSPAIQCPDVGDVGLLRLEVKSRVAKDDDMALVSRSVRVVRCCDGEMPTRVGDFEPNLRVSIADFIQIEGRNCQDLRDIGAHKVKFVISKRKPQQKNKRRVTCRKVTCMPKGQGGGVNCSK